MTIAELKAEVQVLFPVKFAESLIYSEEPTDIDKTITFAVKKAFTKYEKIESMEIEGSQYFTRAASILKCVPNAADRKSSTITVWDTMPIPGQPVGSVKHYFGPDKFLRLWPDDESVWIEYKVATDMLTVEDLSPIYCDWVVEYANALLKIKEGYIGTSATLTTLPFEFNYQQMLDEGKEVKRDKETELEDMNQGTLAIRIS
jgi:hypothetical protein